MPTHDELLRLADDYGLDVVNETVEDTIAQRDALIAAIVYITQTHDAVVTEMDRKRLPALAAARHRAVRKAEALANLIEAIVSGELQVMT